MARDSVMFSVPFTAGAASAVFFSGYIFHCFTALYAAAAAISACIALLCAILCGAARKRRQTGGVSVAALFFLAGVLCALTENICSAGGADVGIAGLTERLSEKMKAISWKIPYSATESRALVNALIFGDRSLLSADITEAFRQSGAAHLLALSGMHLGIIYIFLQKVLSFSGNSPAAGKAKGILGILVSGVYTAATGASPSLVRAFLFICLNETARLTGRKCMKSEIFCAAVTVQLALKPSSISSIGFQLSYLAVLGLLILHPHMSGWYSGGRMNILKRIWDMTSVAVSCQIFTAPAILYYFGTFPEYFILTNLIAVPLTTVIMFLSMAVMTAAISGFCPHLLLALDEKLIEALLFSLKTIADL